MNEKNKFEQGHTNPLTTLAILISMGIVAYLGFDSMDSNDPESWSILETWLAWSWWAKGLSIVVPIALLMVGSRLDDASGFGKLPSDEDVQRILDDSKQDRQKKGD